MLAGVHCEIGEDGYCVTVSISLNDNELEGTLPVRHFLRPFTIP